MSFIRFNNKFIRLDGKLANLTESNEVLSTFTLNFDNCSYSLGGTEEYTFVEGTTWAEWLADDRFNHYPSLAYTDYDQKYAAGNRDGYIKVREYQNPDNIEAGFLCWVYTDDYYSSNSAMVRSTDVIQPGHTYTVHYSD